LFLLGKVIEIETTDELATYKIDYWPGDILKGRNILWAAIWSKKIKIFVFGFSIKIL